MRDGIGGMLEELSGGLFSEGMAGALMAAGVALMTLVLLRRLWRRGKRRRSSGARKPVAARREDADRASRERLDRVMVEVQELTRLCAAQMENRALRLERLIQEADEKIRRLEGMGGEGSDRLYEYRGAARGDAMLRGPAREERSAPGSGLLADDGIDPVTRRVYEMADRGEGPVQIASALEEHVGKVELILALRGR